MRRTHGAGTIEQVASGRWRYKISVADGERRCSPPFDTEEEATSQLDAALYLLRVGEMSSVGAMTLAGYGERWLAGRRGANATTEHGLWRHHVDGTELAAMPITEIRTQHILEWLSKLAQKRALVQVVGGGRAPGPDLVSPQTCKLCLSLVRTCLSAAMADHIISVNPAFRLKTEFLDRDLDEKWKFLSQEEIEQLLSCSAIPPMARLHYQWAIASGARQGESWGLRWADLDLNGAASRATLRRSYDGPTKARKVRRFAILPLALDALLQWRELAPSRHPDALVWPSRRGGMRAEGDDMGWADRSRGAQGIAPGHKTLAGIQRAVVYHDLRHTTASHLIMGTWGRRWSLEEVCKYLGHSSITVTERYAHIGPEYLQDAVTKTTFVVPPSPVKVLAAGIATDSPPSVTAARLERATYCLGNSCSIQLSYAVSTDL